MSGEWSPDVQRLADFDEDEWARVERAYAGRLIAYIGRRVSDAEARDDIVQEVFLGAVRGIGSFDRKYSFEQYLFGICRNRTIDHLRKRRMVGAGQGGSDDGDEAGGIDLDSLALDDETPSRIVRRSDVQGRGRELLRDALRAWVQETWAAAEFNRLMVVEALFRGGWRNRDTWERFGLRDETAVAGVKFRALKKLREHVAKHDPDGEAVQALAQLAEDGEVPTGCHALLVTGSLVGFPERSRRGRGSLWPFTSKKWAVNGVRPIRMISLGEMRKLSSRCSSRFGPRPPSCFGPESTVREASFLERGTLYP
ncbi:MAG: RNA polymerase sigma factor (sigma-70 family) [Planctomycetota bacterium]|jgi:RNA polymerase sigma factor (sigma-70 family)